MKLIHQGSGAVIALGLLCLAARAERYEWADRMPGTNSKGSAIGLDATGNVYIAGTFNGDITIGTNQFTSAGGTDLFLAKLDANGNTLWAVTAGGPGDDTVHRIAVSRNGAMFLCGGFSTNAVFGTNALGTASNGLSGPFIARIDGGVLDWIDWISDGDARAITLSPDEGAVWTVGMNAYQISVRSFGQGGTVLTNFTVGGPSGISPAGIAVSSNGNIFVTGSFAQSLDLGTTNLTANFWAQFTAAINPIGGVLWAWCADSGYRSFGNAVTLARDGTVVSAGSVQRSMFGGAMYDYAFAAKHLPDGTFLWLRTIGEHRGTFFATDAAVDLHGYVLITGRARGYYFDPRSRDGLLLGLFSPDGRILFDHRINSANASDDNYGSGIACDADGSAYFTGWLKGVPTFGTNIMAAGPSGIANAFVARRYTFEPEVGFCRAGTNFVLSWQRTALPFALQTSDDVSTQAWMNHPVPPEDVGGRNQSIIPNTAPIRFFRLTMTNEAPIRHPPVVFALQADWIRPFLGRQVVFDRASNEVNWLTFSSGTQDADEDPLTLHWFNGDTGQELTNGVSMHVAYTYPERYPYYIATLMDTNLPFATGTHTLSLSASDGAFTITNSLTFEVISMPAATSELIAAVQDSAGPGADALVAPLQAARDAVSNRQFNVAIDQLQEFRTRLAASILSDEDKTHFDNAADVLARALRNEYS